MPSPAKFKRFRWPELALHWSNAIPFVLLLFSGGNLLASRFYNLDRETYHLLVTLHKTSAIVWLIALPLTVTVLRPRVHWENLRAIFLWGRDDILWFIQSVRSLYDKTATLPLVGRFNAGQKTNSLLVFAYFFGFGVSGLLMLFRGSILVPWYVHASLFFAAITSVGGHLFLSLINPGTRTSLPGIFTGWAPLSYIEHHHPLSLPEDMRARAEEARSESHHDELRLARAESVILALVFIMGGVGLAVFSQGRLASLDKSFAAVIRPQDLSSKHQSAEGPDSCTQCHSYTGEIEDAKCEACHDDVRRRRAEGIGYHGGHQGPCRACHVEHPERETSIVPLDPDTFDHTLTGFTLTGSHRILACPECHEKKRTADMEGIFYIGLSREQCTDCHVDPHTGQFVTDCESCHSTEGFVDEHLLFSHDDYADFALDESHTTVTCARCHIPETPRSSLATARFRGLSTECADCHEHPHGPNVGEACTDCHTQAGWTGSALLFDHEADTTYALTNSHEHLGCTDCHSPDDEGPQTEGGLAFAALDQACETCHADPHRGQFGQKCRTCHQTTKFVGDQLMFSHDKDSAFQLKGAHSSVACAGCHKPRGTEGTLASAAFKGLDTECGSCHGRPHPAGHGSICVACHDIEEWPGGSVGFDHGSDTSFALVGKHESTPCEQCHAALLARNLLRRERTGRSTEYACRSCHPQREHGRSLSDECGRCHSPEGWSRDDLIFDHNTMSKFSMDGTHASLPCEACHERKRWKPLSPACGSCHEGGR